MPVSIHDSWVGDLGEARQPSAHDTKLTELTKFQVPRSWRPLQIAVFERIIVSLDAVPGTLKY
jgi:hypothetical protein